LPRRAAKKDGGKGEAFRIGDAGARGKGVYAESRVEPGELVWDYAGVEKWIKEIPSQLWQYCFQVDYDRYVVPEKESVGWFLNHSCEPNCAIMGRTKIVALRRIEPGEEVTFDYSTNVGWEGFSMDCECGKKACRKTVRSYSLLSDELKGRYGACVSGFLLGPTLPKASSDLQ